MLSSEDSLIKDTTALTSWGDTNHKKNLNSGKNKNT